MWIYIPPDVEENGGLCSCNASDPWIFPHFCEY